MTTVAAFRSEGPPVGDRRRGRATHERVHITRNGREYVVLLAAEDLESIEATLELLSDPAAQERLRRSQDEVDRGEVLDEAEVRAMVAKRRLSNG